MVFRCRRVPPSMGAWDRGNRPPFASRWRRLYSSVSGPALAAGEGFRALACLLTALAAWHQRDLVASARAARAAVPAPAR